MKNNTIVFDLLNNDNKEIEAIKAAYEFALKNSNYSLIIVGNQKTIEDNLPSKLNNIEIINSTNIVKKPSENIREILTHESSMLSAFDILKERNADAILSSGDSGSFISMAALKVKRLENISRPAFMPVMPSLYLDSKILLLDAGANVEIKSNYLEEWAILADAFYKSIFKSKPRIGILNIGTEEYKGPLALREANESLKKNKNINYLSFIEPEDIIVGNADVVVSDGYAGNLFLKTLEETVINIGKVFKNIIMSKTKNKIAGLLLKKDLTKFKEKFDYRNVGGAYLIGLEKIIVKAHGRSDAQAFLGALNQIKFALENNLMENLRNDLEQNNKKEE